MVVLDGLADRRHPELDGKTPLEAACTPNLDALAARGSCGIMYTVAPGVAPTSDIAHFVMFGYPIELFPGRGYIEALGEGITPGAADVVLRASFVTVEERDDAYVIIERQDPRTPAEKPFADTLPDEEIEGLTLRFLHTGGRQGLLFVTGPPDAPASPHVTDADPFADGVPVIEVQALADAADHGAARRTARALNEYMRRARARLLETRGPFNFVVTKWAGRRIELESFPERTGLTALCLGSGPLYAGLAAALGMDHREVGEDLAAPGEDLAHRLVAAEEALGEHYEFVHVHTKAADHAAHTKNPLHKRDVIEELDDALAPLLGQARRRRASGRAKDRLVVVTADHATPSAGPLIHSGEAVPLLMWGPTAGPDPVGAFSEAACASGSLGQLSGTDLMPMILNVADRARFLGQRNQARSPLAANSAADLPPLRPTAQG